MQHGKDSEIIHNIVFFLLKRRRSRNWFQGFQFPALP